ncbi:MAG: proton-conducting transporter membrane subunit, partial [Pirellulales bacterium]
MIPTHESVLLATICLPLLGVGLVWAVAPSGRAVVRLAALGIVLLTVIGAVWLAYEFPPDSGDFDEGDFAASDFVWLELSDLDVHFSVGLDGISLWLFVLSAVLSLTALLASWRAIEDRPAEFYAMLLLLESGMLGVFAARDLVLFYVFFEFVLIPLFFLIGVWGSEDRRYAAMKFFLFTLTGS